MLIPASELRIGDAVVKPDSSRDRVCSIEDTPTGLIRVKFYDSDSYVFYYQNETVLVTVRLSDPACY